MQNLKILFVEDVQLDYELAIRQLRKEELLYESTCVDSRSEFINALENFQPDLIISDYSMPTFNGLEALHITLDKKPEIPFIVLTGSINEETAVECMRAGAADYVLKEKLHRLPFSVKETLKWSQERKEKLLAEKQLRESETRFRDVFESANVGKVITSQNKAIIVNQAFADMLGYTSQELQNMDWRDFTPAEDIEHNEKIIAPLYRGEQESIRYQKRYIHKNGSHVWVDISVILHRDAEGEIEYLISTIIDITENKQAELALRESEAKFRSFFLNNHAMMMLIDPSNGDIMDVNPEACSFYGYSREELLTKKITEINTLSLDEVNVEMQKALREERNYFNFRHRLANGEIRDVEIYSGPIDHLGKKLLYSIIHDITARKQAEKAFKELNELLNLFIKYSPIYAYIKEVTDSSISVIIASENYIDMVGIPGSKMAGKTMLELFPTEFAEKIMTDDKEVVRNGQVLKLDEELNGRFYTTIKFPINQGERTLLAGYTIDITDRKLAEKALEQKVDELLRFHNLTVDRELKMVELKKEVNQLLQNAGKPPRYKIIE